MAVHEQNCVRRALEIDEQDLVVWNLVSAAPPESLLDETDAHLIGGSGAFHVFDEQPWLERTRTLCRERLMMGSTPFLGLCFGHQLLASSAGCEVITDPATSEVGTFEIELTEAGQSDPLFRGLPQRFMAQLGHSDRVLSMPEDWTNLARSQRVPLQAYRVAERPVWGVQFHPELECQDNLLRFRNYAEHYGLEMGADLPPDVLARFKESPLSQQILKAFADYVQGASQS